MTKPEGCVCEKKGLQHRSEVTAVLKTCAIGAALYRCQTGR